MINQPTIYRPNDKSTPNTSTNDISTNLLAKFLQHRPQNGRRRQNRRQNGRRRQRSTIGLFDLTNLT
jgi:hypothetical protein